MRVNDSIFMSATQHTSKTGTRKIGTGPKACFCLGFLLWGIWLQGLVLRRGLASPYKPQDELQPLSSRPGASHETDTHTIDGKSIRFPPSTALVTVYQHDPSVYHWQPDCPNIVTTDGQLMSLPIQKMSSARAEAHGYKPCPVCGDSDTMEQIRNNRSEITNNLVSLRHI
jgi:hypothetical protein